MKTLDRQGPSQCEVGSRVGEGEEQADHRAQVQQRLQVPVNAETPSAGSSTVLTEATAGLGRCREPGVSRKLNGTHGGRLE